MLPGPVNQISPGEYLGIVTADGTFDTRKGHESIVGRNADGVVPQRKNAKVWKAYTRDAKARNEAVRVSK